MFGRILVDFTDSVPLLAAFKYLKGQVTFRLGLRGHHSGATANRSDSIQASNYVRKVFKEYLQYGSLQEGDIVGLDILEIGPGDTLGVALLFLAKGANSVTCLDRFRPRIDLVKNKQICENLYSSLSVTECRRVDHLMDALIRNQSSDDGRLNAIYGEAVEKYASDSSNRKFGLIVSRAVLEHVYDLQLAWNAMVACLSETGQMLHKVDFRNHKFFSKIHPLYFLVYSDLLWKLISSPDPTLNRERMDTYRALLERTFSDFSIYITSVLDNPELQPHLEQIGLDDGFSSADLDLVGAIRPRLLDRFRSLTDLDLLVSGIFINAKKPL